MSVQWSITIKSKIPEAVKDRRAFDEGMRGALTAAGILWTQKYLPMHFQAGAAGRYGYQARGYRYDQRKQRITGQRPLPLIFFEARFPGVGKTLKSTVLANAESGAIRSIPVVRGGRYELRVPVRIPHPIHPKIASGGGPGTGEIVRKIKGEVDDMAATINRVMKQVFNQKVSVKVIRMEAR